MKTLHLWLCAAIVVRGTSSTFGQTYSPHRATPTWFQSGMGSPAFYGAQANGVPLPPGVADGSTSGLVDVPPAPPSTVGIPSVPSGQAASPIDGSVPGSSGIGLPDSTTWNAFSPPLTSDPFLNGGGGAQPYAPYSPYGSTTGQSYPFGSVPPPGPMNFGSGPIAQPYSAPGAYTTYGANGAQPYRMGWQHSIDTHYIPNVGATGGSTGNFEEFGVNFDLANTSQTMPGWLMTLTHQFRMRMWDGPIGGAGLPGNAFRFGEDIEFSTPQTGPFSMSLAVTPSINSDLDASLSSEAFQLDGRGIIWWQVDQFWTLGLGAMYWDRVKDRVLPYAGLVYRDDFWEWRLMFPESEIRLFLGTEPRWAKWVYLRGGYNVEAFEISTGGGIADEVEIEDWQLMAGFQMDAGAYRWYIEAGVLFDREVNYRRNATFTTGDAFMTRLGWRY